MNIWLEGLYQEEIRKIENNKQEDMSLSNGKEELQDTTAKGRRENVKAVRGEREAKKVL